MGTGLGDEELLEDDLLLEDDDEDERDDAEFGEYLVEEGRLSRAELREVLDEQARQGDVHIAEVIAWMGYLPYGEVDRLLTQWRTIPTLEADEQESGG